MFTNGYWLNERVVNKTWHSHSEEWLFEVMDTKAMELHRKYSHASLMLRFVKKNKIGTEIYRTR